jgi:hypothetical protein
MKETSRYLRTRDALNQAKEACGITKPSSELSDDEIRIVVRWIGKHALDTQWRDGKPVFGRIGIGAMLFVTVSEFPEFYQRYGLSQFN